MEGGTALSPRPANPELARRAVETVAAIVEERGPGAVTVVEVAKRVGYTAAAIYRYFDSRDVLLDRTIDYGVKRLADAIDVEALAAETDPVRRLRMLAHFYVSWGAANPGMYRLIFEHPVPVRPTEETRKKRQGALRNLEAEFRRGSDDGRLRGVESPPAEAMLLWSSLHGIVSLTVSGRLFGPQPKRGMAAQRAGELAEALIDHLEPYWKGETS
ncbi:MAG: TetR/AcrR family transcriptional regulator [Actinobacteria bacterium]|nr:MAG: TetR/AcrR family transcriptional regulator [Actinomycetota bacterium]